MFQSSKNILGRFSFVDPYRANYTLENKRNNDKKKKFVPYIYMGNLCNHTPKGKILPFRNFTFYFSNSMDFMENKPHFIHCNSDIEDPSKNTLMHFDIINCSEKPCST